MKPQHAMVMLYVCRAAAARSWTLPAMASRTHRFIPSCSTCELRRVHSSCFCNASRYCGTLYARDRRPSSRITSFRSIPPSMFIMSSHSISESSPEQIGQDDSKSHTTEAISDLSELIEESYQSGETDGVQDALLSNHIVDKLSATLDADEVANRLVDVGMEAAGRSRGKLAAILNAILASCCGSCDDATAESASHPQAAFAILTLMDEMHATDATAMVDPDIVSLSLVYYSLQQAVHRGASEFESVSQAILERAQRAAKKSAGSARRRELAAERRKGSNDDADQAESHLRSLYGPDICILHDDDDMIIISKPAGMVCYHTKKTSAGKLTSSRKKKSRASKDGTQQMDISLVDALLDVSISLSTLNPTARGIVHRLDRGTSGSIILAKSDEAHLRLVAMFFLRRVKKKYLALVPGCDDSMDEKAALETTHLPVKLGAAGVIDVLAGGRPAQSTYKVVEEYGKQSTLPEALLLEVETLTGRKHQVRVHCSDGLGRPIFLDQLYPASSKAGAKPNTAERGRKKKVKGAIDTISPSRSLPAAIANLLDGSNQPQERFFLHAKSLSIPELGITVDAPLPSWWEDTIDQFN